MPVIRSLHLLFALVIPALLGIISGALWALCTADRRRTTNAVMRVVGWLAPRLAGLRIQCSNRHFLAQRPAVVVFNHQSGLDPVILCALLQRDAVGVAKQPLARNLLLGPLLRFPGTIFLGEKTERRTRVLEQAQVALDSGLSIVMAPEGTRVQSPSGVGRFRSGACEIAQRCGVPVLPVVIHNSGERLAARGRQLFPGPVRVTVLPPRWIALGADLEKATRELEQAYVAALAPT
ncbi:MAG: lysophospholipid acyltransferase family protein [Pseudomonadota bacterium]